MDKLCVDCKHHELWYVKNEPFHRCNVFAISKIDLVTGDYDNLVGSNCYDLRSVSGKCGIAGKHWEQKD